MAGHHETLTEFPDAYPRVSKVRWRTHLANWSIPAPRLATVRHPRFLTAGRSPAPRTIAWHRTSGWSWAPDGQGPGFAAMVPGWSLLSFRGGAITCWA